jgi:transposase-like protein
MEGAPRRADQGPESDLLSCPFCEASNTITIQEVDLVAFLCESCGEMWKIELGYIHRIRSRRPGSSPLMD